jgi:hypothetical protein
MRAAHGISLLLACAGLVSCGEQKVECGNDAVMGTLSSMVRARLLRVMEDANPASLDAARRAALTRATRIAPKATRLLEWDAISGRLTCIARFVVDAPGPGPNANERSEIELRYRVTRDDGDTFFVEVGYTEMMSLFPARSDSGR